MTDYETFTEALESHGRAPEIASADDVYGWLIGGWELDVKVYDDQGGMHESKGEATPRTGAGRTRGAGRFY